MLESSLKKQLVSWRKCAAVMSVLLTWNKPCYLLWLLDAGSYLSQPASRRMYFIDWRFNQFLKKMISTFRFQLRRKPVTSISAYLALTHRLLQQQKTASLTIIFSVRVEYFRVVWKCFRWGWTSGSSGLHGFRLGWLAALPCLLFKSWESNVTHFVGRKIICIETGKSIRYHKAC